MNSTTIMQSVDEGVAKLTLNRPEVRNALTPELIDDFQAALAGFVANDEVRSVVIEGSGPAFCAGMDLKIAASDPEVMRSMLHGLAKTMMEMRKCRVPVIARVQGAAVGGGCGLMTACDFVVSHPDAKLGYPEVDHGICPAVVAPWLIRKIGGGRARALLLSGGTITGQHALDIGLVSHLVPREEIDATIETLTRRIAKGGRNALAATKHWLNELEGTAFKDELAKGADISADVLAGAEAQERLNRSHKR